VVGLGHIAQAAVLPAFAHARRNSVLTALVSSEHKKLKILGARYGIARLCSYKDADELFASGEIDAVYIALPNDMHKDFTIRAARAGLHILCEKPMAVTGRECEQMIQATEKANVKLMIAYRLHFERANLEAALRRSGGRIYGKNGAAAILGVPPTTLASRLRALGVSLPGRRPFGPS